MDRRKAIGLATSVSVAAAGSILAVGANLGLFGLSAAETPPPLPVQQIADASSSPVGAPVQEVIEETRVIDVPVHVPAQASAAAPAPAADATLVQASTSDDATSDDASSDDARDDDSDDARPAGSPSDDGTEHEDEDEHEDDAYEAHDGERRDDECEVHDDGEVECHDEDD